MTHAATNGNPPLHDEPNQGQTPPVDSSKDRQESGSSPWFHRLDAALRAQIEARPYVVLGTAVGLGWLLGRGLATPVGKTFAVVAGRYLVKELMGV